MAVNKKRDFKRLSLCIQDFLKRLPSNETTGFLRDTLYLSLLELHKYYIKEKERLNLSLQQTNETGNQAIVHEHTWKDVDKYGERWRDCDDGGRFITAVEGNIQDLHNNILSDDCDSLGRTYLMYAIHGDHEQKTIEYILSLNFNVNHQAQDGSSVLHVACQHQKTTITALLLKNKASVSTTDNKGRSALHWAAKCQLSDMVKLLLQYGADINVKDCDGMTPAMWACYFNKPDNFHILRNALSRVDPRPEAILDEQDNLGRTVLHWTAMTCDCNSSLLWFKELLVMSDVCKIKDNEGRTILHTATIQGSLSICEEIILSCGKEILNVKDNENQTALHLATLCGHGDMVDFLLQHGVNSSVENKNERTALQEAEIGHYHYCLLVFAAFEQMKDKTRPPSVKYENDLEKKNKDRRYESWVIPSTSLNESHDIPIHLTREQLVDVTEIKGFEINDGDPDDQIISLPEKHVPTKVMVTQNPAKDNSAPTTIKRASKSDNPVVKPDNPVVKPDNPVVKPDNPVVKPDNPVVKPDNPVVKPDNPATSTNMLIDKTPVTGRSNKNASLQRSERVEEIKEIKEEDMMIPGKNMDGISLPLNQDRSPQNEEEYSSQYLQQNGSQSESDDENIEISSLNIESEDDESSAQEMNTHEENINNKESHKKNIPQPNTTYKDSSGTERNKGSLAPIKPLPQPSFSLPSKLDPIPLLHSNKKPTQSRGIITSPSRGIVAPLQPPVQKEQSGLSLLSRDKLQHYGTPRGPEHGPLAQTHSKELLNNVFKENLNKEQKSEIQRRPMQPTKLSRPTVRH